MRSRSRYQGQERRNEANRVCRIVYERQKRLRQYTIGLFLCTMGLVVWFGASARMQSDRAHRLGEEIQQSRLATATQTCEDTNRRHDDTINALDLLLKSRLSDPHLTASDKARIRASRDSTVALIDALAPRHPSTTRGGDARTCAQLAVDLVTPPRAATTEP